MAKPRADREKVKEKKVFIRMTKSEFEQIRQNAQMFGQGNMSNWIRERALDVAPKADEIKKDK